MSYRRAPVRKLAPKWADLQYRCRVEGGFRHGTPHNDSVQGRGVCRNTYLINGGDEGLLFNL